MNWFQRFFSKEKKQRLVAVNRHHYGSNEVSSTQNVYDDLYNPLNPLSPISPLNPMNIISDIAQAEMMGDVLQNNSPMPANLIMEAPVEIVGDSSHFANESQSSVDVSNDDTISSYDSSSSYESSSSYDSSDFGSSDSGGSSDF